MEQKKFDPNSIMAFDIWDIAWIMYQNQPDPAVIAAEKQKRWWFRKLKLKLNDKVVTEATVAVATTGDAAISTIRKETRKFCLFRYIAVSSE
jgi:YidC/Oxa1 family membrane protein insertase